MNRNKIIFFILLVALIAAIVFVIFGNSGLLQSLTQAAGNNNKLILPIIAAAALVDSLNPCAFSVLLITIGFLVSLGTLRTSIIKIGLTYIAGLYAVYTLIGVGVLNALSFLGIPNFMGKLGAAIIIVFGLIEIIGEVYPNFPIKLKIPQSGHDKIAKLVAKSSYPTALILGIVVGLYEFPCTGGPYLFVLGLLHDNTTFSTGLYYLLFYNVIFVAPLFIILLLASNKFLLSKVEGWKKNSTRSVRFYGGIAMVILGLVIFLL